MKKNTVAKVPQETTNLNRVFHALADETRRDIIAQLSQANGTVSALAEPFDMSLNAVSKHLKVLEGAQLIEREIIGRTSVCSLKADVLQDAMSWIDQYSAFWGETLDALEAHMDKQLGDFPNSAGDEES